VLTQELASVVRDTVRQTVAEELQQLALDSRRAAQALREVRRVANLRMAMWSVGITTMCSGGSLALLMWLLPSQGQIDALRARRDQLAAVIAILQRSGGHIDVRRCGEGERLCVRVDRTAPAYGAHGDYLVVKGSEK
jgi:hypothetical protein